MKTKNLIIAGAAILGVIVLGKGKASASPSLTGAGTGGVKTEPYYAPSAGIATYITPSGQKATYEVAAPGAYILVENRFTGQRTYVAPGSLTAYLAGDWIRV